MGRLTVRASPGADRDELRWDPWRKVWVVACRAPAVEGEANAALLALLAEWLGVPRGSLRWVAGGRSRTKVLEAEDLLAEELQLRLEQRVQRSASRSATADGGPDPPGS